MFRIWEGCKKKENNTYGSMDYINEKEEEKNNEHGGGHKFIKIRTSSKRQPRVNCC